MSPSKDYIDLMKELEGLKLCPYLDSAGIPTIGIGTTRYENGLHVQVTDKCIDEQRAVDLLLHDTISNQILINSLIPVLNNNQNDAILSFIYNEGPNAFKSSTLLSLILADPSDPKISDAFMMWTKAHVDGQLIEIEGLKNRREQEISLYFS